MTTDSFFKNQALKQLLCNAYLIPFCISFTLVFYYIFPFPDMLMGGGDATSIWQTITTFRSDKITSSYVLYKGFLSVYPYIWFLELSKFLGLDPFFFIKIYHAVLFSFVAAIGIPYVVSRILAVEIKLFKNIIFVILLFYLTRFTNIFHLLMIDLPSWAFFVGALYFSFLCIKKNQKINILKLFVAGGFTGLTLSASGQYSLAGYLIVIYVVISIIKQSVGYISVKSIMSLFLLVVAFSTGMLIPKIYDAHFNKTIVQPMRDRGEWLPTGAQWLGHNLTASIMRYKPLSNPAESNRGLAILKKQEGDGFEKRYDQIKAGGGSYSGWEYTGIALSNPINFGMLLFNKAFLAISWDDGGNRVSHLIVSYTALFICLYLAVVKLHRFRDLLNLNVIVILSIFLTIAAPMLMHIEARYSVSIIGFILGFAVHQNTLASNLKGYLRGSELARDERGCRHLKDLTIPYPMIGYVIYMIFCFMLYGVFLEIDGSVPANVLFKW